MIMRKTEIHKLASGAVVAAATAVGMICQAYNPIIQTKFTADPAPMVSSNTVCPYTSHDEADAIGFKMTRTVKVEGMSGRHDVFLTFVGVPGFLLNVNWWKFE